MNRFLLLGLFPFIALAFACGDDGAVTPDGSLDACADCDAAMDAPADTTAPPEPCAMEGEVACSADASAVRTCTGGFWVDDPCAPATEICDAGGCVTRWTYGAPSYDQCEDAENATPETLADKAAYFDELAVRLSLSPSLGAVTEVVLTGGADEHTATTADIAARGITENNGLWNALYMASQAYRHAATGSADALETLRILVRGEEDRMAITGVPGNFTRRFILADTVGAACPTDPAEYTVDVEKDDNRWVQIRDDGCAWAVDNETGEWFDSGHCVDPRFAGGCFFDNVSQDEVVGHVLGLAAVATLVDDADVSSRAAALLEAVGLHLVENQMQFVDWDGRVTEHGMILSPILGLAFVRVAGLVSGNEEILRFYDECLLQNASPPDNTCVPWLASFLPLDRYLSITLLYPDETACRANWNNMSMALASLNAWLSVETDPEMARVVRQVLDEDVMRYDNTRAMIVQHNPWWNFIWARDKALGPESDGPALEPVREGICALRQVPATRGQVARDPSADHPTVCMGRLDESLTDVPLRPDERCPKSFLFWFNPYDLATCSDQPERLQQPGDYLLPYWMGRYYGFIDG